MNELSRSSNLNRMVASKQSVLESVTICPKCTARLHCKANTDFLRQRVEEVQVCPECRFERPKVFHRLQ